MSMLVDVVHVCGHGSRVDLSRHDSGDGEAFLALRRRSVCGSCWFKNNSADSGVTEQLRENLDKASEFAADHGFEQLVGSVRQVEYGLVVRHRFVQQILGVVDESEQVKVLSCVGGIVSASWWLHRKNYSTEQMIEALSVYSSSLANVGVMGAGD